MVSTGGQTKPIGPQTPPTDPQDNDGEISDESFSGVDEQTILMSDSQQNQQNDVYEDISDKDSNNNQNTENNKLTHGNYPIKRTSFEYRQRNLGSDFSDCSTRTSAVDFPIRQYFPFKQYSNNKQQKFPTLEPKLLQKLHIGTEASDKNNIKEVKSTYSRLHNFDEVDLEKELSTPINHSSPEIQNRRFSWMATVTSFPINVWPKTSPTNNIQPKRDCHFPSFKSSKTSITDDNFGRSSSTKRVRFESSRQKRSSSMAPSLHINEYHNDVIRRYHSPSPPVELFNITPRRNNNHYNKEPKFIYSRQCNNNDQQQNNSKYLIGTKRPFKSLRDVSPIIPYRQQLLNKQRQQQSIDNNNYYPQNYNNSNQRQSRYDNHFHHHSQSEPRQQQSHRYSNSRICKKEQFQNSFNEKYRNNNNNDYYHRERDRSSYYRYSQQQQDQNNQFYYHNQYQKQSNYKQNKYGQQQFYQQNYQNNNNNNLKSSRQLLNNFEENISIPKKRGKWVWIDGMDKEG